MVTRTAVLTPFGWLESLKKVPFFDDEVNADRDDGYDLPARDGLFIIYPMENLCLIDSPNIFPPLVLCIVQ